ncbi:MAG: hypothetical protein HY763_04150 [Planctomycetes bacterium]|nr:hypothetical protein [Planctomycetota bacterium]
MPAGCRAPAGAPTGAPPREQRLQITDTRGHLEFTARQREQDQRSKVGAGRTRSEESIFEESVKLELTGHAYHPNFLEFALAGLFGLRQQDFEERFDDVRRKSGDDGTFHEFDLSARFFKKKNYPGTVYARRYRSLDARPFQSSLETTTTNYGVLWQYITDKSQTSLQFSHTDVRLEPVDESEDPGRQRNTQFRFDTSYRFNEGNVLSFTYNRLSVKEEPFNLEYDSDELTLGHRLDFGPGNRHRLESELNYYDQRGSFPVERLRWREILRLKHSETLETWYLFEAIDREQGNLSGVPPIDERSYYGSATLEHKLFESLISQFQLFAQRQSFGSGLDIERLGGNVSFDYRKKNRWGTLLANYRMRLQTEERSGGRQDFEVLDERHTFRDPDPVVLSNPSIVVSSIFVTAEDRNTLYQEGRDYRVFVVGDQVELERVPLGRIADGQTVLIDYVNSIGGDFTLDTFDQHLSLRQNFSFGLSPYYRLRRQEQELSPRNATGVTPDDITANLFGAEYKRGPLRLTAEFEDHESTINPFQATRLSADLTHRFKTRATASLKTRWSDVDREGAVARNTQFFTIEGRYRHPITPKLTLEAAVLYRREKDSRSGDDEGVDVDLALEWFIRETEIRVTYEFGKFEDDFAENESSALFVQVKRRF